MTLSSQMARTDRMSGSWGGSSRRRSPGPALTYGLAAGGVLLLAVIAWTFSGPSTTPCKYHQLLNRSTHTVLSYYRQYTEHRAGTALLRPTAVGFLWQISCANSGCYLFLLYSMTGCARKNTSVDVAQVGHRGLIH